MSIEAGTDFRGILPEGDIIILSSDSSGDEEARIIIDRDSNVSFATISIRVGGRATVTSDKFYRRALSYRVASTGCGFSSKKIAIDAGKLRADLAPRGTLAVLINAIIGGRSVDWNGLNDVGTLDNKAQEAEAELRWALADGAYIVDAIVCSAYDWLTTNESPKAVLESCGLAVDATDQDIAKVAELERKAAEMQGIIICDDFEVALRRCIVRVNSSNRGLA